MAEFISGRKLGGAEAAEARKMSNRCSTDAVSGYSRRTQPGMAGLLTRPMRVFDRRRPYGGEVPRTALKWAFGFPGVSSLYGQPTVAGGRVFVGVDTGYV